MTRLSRALLAAASVLLLGVFVLPLWRIELTAPQYPEGLGMVIRVNAVTGIKPHDLANINGLNHYIGMKAIEPDSIPELRIMPWIVAGLAAFGLLGAAVGRRRFLYAWLVSFVAVAVVGLIDFWRWEYDYGHNLDFEHAIIKIPGMTYQPPLIGTKQLLNFTATSWPDAGAMCLGIAFALGVAALVIVRRSGQATRRTSAAVAVAVAAACTPAGPRTIAYDHDVCDYCRMTISDDRFGGQFITAKGKVHAFDSVECLVSFYIAGRESTDDGRAWVADFANRGDWIAAEHAVYARTDSQRSPMGLDIVSFGADADTAMIRRDFNARIMRWVEVVELVKSAHLADASDTEHTRAAH